MNKRSIILVIIYSLTILKLFSQNHSAKNIYEKSHEAIRNIHKGSFNISVESNADSETDTIFQSGQVIFYKDSVDESETPQFFIVQNNDTVLIYNGDNYFEIDKDEKTITVGRVRDFKRNIGNIIVYSTIYFYNGEPGLCYPTHPHKFEGIEKVNSYDCYKIKDTSNLISNDSHFILYGFTYIDTSSYLLIKREIFCEQWLIKTEFSQIHRLSINDNFVFDVNLFAMRKHYNIEKAEEWGLMARRPETYMLTDLTKTKFILDSTRTTITAVDSTGHIIWSTDPLKQIHGEHHIHDRPLIISFSLSQSERTKKEFIRVEYDDSMWIVLNKETGKFGYYDRD